MASLAGYQTSLFAQGLPALSPTAEIERNRLDDMSWIDLSRGWLQGADHLLDVLAASLPWKGGRRPMYGEMVDEPRLHASIRPGGPKLTATVTDAMAAITEVLEARYGAGLSPGFVNFYRDGSDSVAWHADRVGVHEVDPIIALVSLGGPRRFQLRPMAGSQSDGRPVRLELHSGDLLVMGGACQHAWEHCVPKMASAPPRMSISFRHVPDDGGDSWWTRDFHRVTVPA